MSTASKSQDGSKAASATPTATSNVPVGGNEKKVVNGVSVENERSENSKKRKRKKKNKKKKKKNNKASDNPTTTAPLNKPPGMGFAISSSNNIEEMKSSFLFEDQYRVFWYVSQSLFYCLL